VDSLSDPNRMPAATSIDITVTRGSSTPCGDPLILNVQDPDTGTINQYPATQMGSCLNPLWHVSIPIGMNANTPYKCWPSRDTDNTQSVAMLPNGQIAYNKCGAEVNDYKENFRIRNQVYLDVSTTTNINGCFMG
jgi:hypothetical protein